MAASSHGDETGPIDGRMPFSRMVLGRSGDTYCEPQSPRWTHPSGGFLLASAIFNASSASSAAMLGHIDYPTMRRDHMSIASAKCSQPWRVLTQAMPANHAALGPAASNLRPTRSSADSRLDAHFSPEGRLAHTRSAGATSRRSSPGAPP